MRGSDATSLQDVLPEDLYRGLLKAATDGAALEYHGPRPAADEREHTKPHRTFVDHDPEC